MSLPPQGVEQGGGGLLRSAIFEVMQWYGKDVHFEAECCKKYRLYRKMLPTKVV